MEILFKEKRFIKFSIAAILSAISQFCSLIFLVEILSANPTLSSGVAFLISCIVNYLLLYYWAFESKGKHHLVFSKFSLLIAFTLALNTGIFWTLNVLFGLWYLLSQALATGCIFFFNFFVKKNYVF